MSSQNITKFEMSEKIFERFRNTTFYDPEKFSKTLWEQTDGPITEENLQITDFYIQFFRNTSVRIDIDPNKFMQTINTILKKSDDILRVRSILLLFAFKNVIDIYPYFSMLITEDKIQFSDTGYFSDCDDFLTEKSKYFNHLFYAELIRHPVLMLDVIESIHQLVNKITLKYESIYSIIKSIIISNEESSTPIHPSQLIFFDEKDIKDYANKISKIFPIILPFSIKYDSFKNTNSPQKESKLISSDREKILDTVWEIGSMKENFINSRIRINFINEEDINIEASTREFIDVAFKAIFSPEANLFDFRNNYYWFKYHKETPFELLNKYHCVGFLFGLAIKNKITIPIRFPRYFYKKLLNREVSSSDIAFFDPDLMKSILSLMNSEVTEDMCLDFSYYDSIDKYNVDLQSFTDITDNGSVEVIPLVDSNKKEYFQKLTEWIFNLSISSEFKAFNEGFRENNIDEMFFTSFRLDELDLIVSGAIERDWNELKKSANYVSYDKDSQVIIWFWDYFTELEEEKKLNVLKFITGSSSIPTEGIGSICIRFTRLKETDCLPSIRTCFKEIILPEYKSYEELKQKCNLTFTFL